MSVEFSDGATRRRAASMPDPTCVEIFGLFKILFYFAAFMWESIILLLPPPTCIARTIAILLHVYCARYDAPPIPALYAIHYAILVMAISCKCQVDIDRDRYVWDIYAYSYVYHGATRRRAASMPDST